MSEFGELRGQRYVPGTRHEGTPATQYQVIHGYRRAYVKQGKGSALLFIHGIGDCSDTWRPVLGEMAKQFTVVAPDLLGHGRSEKPRADYSVGAYANAMRDLLSYLGVERATVVGHSLGGAAAAQFAYQYPELCERLVLISSGGIGRTVSPLIRLAAVPGIEVLMPFFGLPPVRLANRLIAQSLWKFKSVLGKDAIEVLAVIDTLPNTAARWAILRGLRSGIDWRGQSITMLDRAYLIEDMPTLLIWGGRDTIIPVGHAQLAHRAIPGSRLEIFDDAGHFPHHVDPRRFIDLLSEFVTETKPKEHSALAWKKRLREGQRGSPLGS